MMVPHTIQRPTLPPPVVKSAAFFTFLPEYRLTPAISSSTAAMPMICQI